MSAALATLPATPTEVRSVARALERAPTEEVVGWAADRLGDGLVLTSSFTDCVLIDVTQRVAPQVPVVFLDTGLHFPETLAYVTRVEARYGLRLERVGPVAAPDDQHLVDPDGCCARRKVAPLGEALQGRTGWLSGLRRADSALRNRTPVVEWDARRGLVKVNPLARWSDADVETYSLERALPRNPLVAQGFPSIGCAPCTRRVAPGEDRRAGRWAGLKKTECGLHL